MMGRPQMRYLLIASTVMLCAGGAAALWSNVLSTSPGARVGEADPQTFDDLILVGGTIVDGTGSDPFVADVVVRGEKIVFIGDVPRESPGVRIACSGLLVTPGFINSHSHTYEVIFTHPGAGSALLQGITTEVGGVDGRSPWPLWEHFQRVAALPPGVNYGMLVGAGTIRSHVMGWGPGDPSEAQLEKMQAMVKVAMTDGTLGLSTGLEYLPGIYTSTAELASLAQAASELGGVYVTHLRSEAVDILSALREAIQIGEQAGIPVGISHLKVAGEANWHMQDEVLALLDEAREAARSEGRELWCDVYPYLSPDYGINVPLAEAVGQHGAHMIVPKLLPWQPPHYPRISKEGADPLHQENTLAQLAEHHHLSPAGMARVLLQGEPDARAQVNLVDRQNLDKVIGWPGTVIANDASARDPSADPVSDNARHPRAYGSFARVLAHHVGEGSLTLPEAVAKMTGLPAALLGLERRGLVQEGFFADITVLDPEAITDTATYTHPVSYPGGIVHVMVNGQIAVRDGKLDPRIRAGQVLLRRPSE